MIIEESILKSINSPEILKTLDRKQIETLAEEIRLFLIKHVSENGGHLASNLGTVELTLALLRCFDFSNDRIVWDVGHQSYTYKILTGRFEQFNTIRKRNGLSGFPKREENKYDHFNTGHSSTSISAALGFARAARLSGSNHYSIAVIGDGALTGGMALEAMNDAGASGDNIIIILNDNEMSISRNVGGIAAYFSRLRSLRLYSGTNEKVRRFVERIPIIGKWLSKRVHNLKSAVKYLFSQGMLFEEMGLSYMGPVNGHDVRKLENILYDAKNVKGPVLLHVVTKKGRGLAEAESEPEKYHGVKGNGYEKSNPNGLLSFSETLGPVLTELAEVSTNIVVISPAVAPGCGLVDFSRKYPDRFFDVGIAEQHAVTLAAGMACSGFIPVVSSYSTFMQRAYDQILHDVCLMNLHVIFTLDRAGIVGYDGETHQGIYDLAYLAHMPGIKVIAPSDSNKLK
ncbi:MAG: 1-deoxy-D-xylulose-5-phosphate synthase, partial [Clostridia bacterium]|nr:1-deoxy-D-xylulose-5-phosphate synthase [Clostridia bacterium]